MIILTFTTNVGLTNINMAIQPIFINGTYSPHSVRSYYKIRSQYDELSRFNRALYRLKSIIPFQVVVVLTCAGTKGQLVLSSTLGNKHNILILLGRVINISLLGPRFGNKFGMFVGDIVGLMVEWLIRLICCFHSPINDK